MRLRLRRNYLMVIGFMSAVWVAKLFIHPTRATSLSEFYSRLHVGEFIPPWFVGGDGSAVPGRRGDPRSHLSSAEDSKTGAFTTTGRRVDIDDADV